MDKTDPTGTKCVGAGNESQCTLDYLNGGAYDARAVQKSNPKLEAKLQRLEGNMTKAYVAAQKLGNATITVKGDPAHGIANTKISGNRIVHEMREFSFNAETRASEQPASPRPGYAG